MTIRALLVLSVGISAGLAAACDNAHGGVRLVSQVSFIAPFGRFSPNPVPFSPIRAFGCPGGAFVFAPSLHLIVTAGVRDLTLDHATIHMLDGSIGGPTVTIPQSRFGTQTSSAFIPAGATRDFVVSPDFGCFTRPPVALEGTAFLVDSQRMNVTIPLEARIR